jgi:hypothetical protein
MRCDGEIAGNSPLCPELLLKIGYGMLLPVGFSRVSKTTQDDRGGTIHTKEKMVGTSGFEPPASWSRTYGNLRIPIDLVDRLRLACASSLFLPVLRFSARRSIAPVTALLQKFGGAARV